MERWRKIYDALYVKKSAIVGKGLYTRTRIPSRMDPTADWSSVS